MIATMESKKAGQTRMNKSRKSLARILALATPDQGCGPEIPVAPGRGPIIAVEPVETRRDFQLFRDDPGREHGAWVWSKSGHEGLKAVRALDALEAMNRRARQAGQPEPFSPPQVEAARHYRALAEKHSIGGIKCVSLEAQGGGGGGGFVEAYMDAGNKLTAMRNVIGPGARLEVRRVRPSKRGEPGARMIFDRDLFRLVCLLDMSLSAVLEAHGWAVSVKNLETLRDALRAILARLTAFI